MEHLPAVELAWEFACVETTAARVQYIEPEHFLAAMRKLRQVWTAEGADELRAL